MIYCWEQATYWVVRAPEGHVVSAGQWRVVLPQVHLKVAEEIHVLPRREGQQRTCTNNPHVLLLGLAFQQRPKKNRKSCWGQAATIA